MATLRRLIAAWATCVTLVFLACPPGPGGGAPDAGDLALDIGVGWTDRFVFGLWEEGTGKYAVEHDLDWLEQWEDPGSSPLAVIDIERYRRAGKTRYAALYREVAKATFAERGLDLNELEANASRAHGETDFALFDVECFLDEGVESFVGIWQTFDGQAEVRTADTFAKLQAMLDDTYWTLAELELCQRADRRLEGYYLAVFHQGTAAPTEILRDTNHVSDHCASCENRPEDCDAENSWQTFHCEFHALNHLPSSDGVADPTDSLAAPGQAEYRLRDAVIGGTEYHVGFWWESSSCDWLRLVGPADDPWSALLTEAELVESGVAGAPEGPKEPAKCQDEPLRLLDIEVLGQSLEDGRGRARKPVSFATSVSPASDSLTLKTDGSGTHNPHHGGGSGGPEG